MVTIGAADYEYKKSGMCGIGWTLRESEPRQLSELHTGLFALPQSVSLIFCSRKDMKVYCGDF